MVNDIERQNPDIRKEMTKQSELSDPGQNKEQSAEQSSLQELAKVVGVKAAQALLQNGVANPEKKSKQEAESELSEEEKKEEKYKIQAIKEGKQKAIDIDPNADLKDKSKAEQNKVKAESRWKLPPGKNVAEKMTNLLKGILDKKGRPVDVPEEEEGKETTSALEKAAQGIDLSEITKEISHAKSDDLTAPAPTRNPNFTPKKGPDMSETLRSHEPKNNG